MGNEEQVKDLVDLGRREFLREDFRTIGGKGDLYNLEKEFASTKKSRRLAFHLTYLLFLGGMVIGSVVTVLWVERKNRNVPIDIADFQDTRMREMLTKGAAGQARLENARTDLGTLEMERDARIRSLRDRFQRERDAMGAMGLSAAEVAERRRQSAAAEAEAVRALEAEYAGRVGELKERIAGMEKESGTPNPDDMDANDKLLSIRLKQQHDAFDRQLTLIREAHRQELEDQMLRYNPVLGRGDVARSLIDNKVSGGEALLRPYQNVLATEADLSPEAFAGFRTVLSNENVLIGRLRVIPFTNSVEKMLERLEAYQGTVIGTYENLWDRLARTLRTRTAVLEAYERAVVSLAKDKTDAGYVLDASSQEKVALVIDPLHAPVEGMQALVYRKDDEPVGRLVLFQSEGRFWGRMTEVRSGVRLKSFDRLLLVKQ